MLIIAYSVYSLCQFKQGIISLDFRCKECTHMSLSSQSNNVRAKTYRRIPLPHGRNGFDQQSSQNTVGESSFDLSPRFPDETSFWDDPEEIDIFQDNVQIPVGAYTDYTAQVHFTRDPVSRGFTAATRILYPLLRQQTLTLRTIIALILLATTIGTSLFTAINAYQQYVQMQTLARHGKDDLVSMKDVISTALRSIAPDPAHPTATISLEAKAKAVLAPESLATIAIYSHRATSEFQQLDQMVLDPQGSLVLVNISPLHGKLMTVHHLARAGLDAAALGTIFAANAGSLLPIFSSVSSITASDGGPIFTPATFSGMQQMVTLMQPAIDDLQTQLGQITLSDIPITGSQQTQLQQILHVLPQARQTFDSAVIALPAVRWALGVDAPRTYLVQTTDRGEMRATGGFTGSFGVLTINGGRLSKIALTDVSLLDFNYPNLYGHANPYNVTGLSVPEPYNTWWPFTSWGLRDTNWSADYPTTAKLAIDTFAKEGGPKVDGVITLSSLVIAHMLAPDVLGSITVPCYNVTVDDQNLENTIHYFQLGDGLKKENECNSSLNSNTSSRKKFTAALAQAMQDDLRKASSDRQGKAVQSLLTDFADKDFQVFLLQASSEQQLIQNHHDTAINRDPSTDATFIVHDNIGANKGSVYVTTKTTETITIDSQGNAQHDLIMEMNYRPTGPVFGYRATLSSPEPMSIRDYIRVYVPPQATFSNGNGFEQNHDAPLCYSYLSCTPKNAPVCEVTSTNPKGLYDPGLLPPSRDGFEGSQSSRIYSINGPTNMQSDEPNRAMFGGLVVIPPFCTAKVKLSWTVPAAVTQHHYQFLEQRQSGVTMDYTLHINTATNLNKPIMNQNVPAFVRDTQWQTMVPQG